MRLDELLDCIIKQPVMSDKDVDARIDAVLLPLKTEILPVGITNYDLAIISTYLTSTIGWKSPIDVSYVAKSLGLNINDARIAFDSFVSLGILEKSGEDTYTIERGIRHELTRRTSVVMLSEFARRYLATNASADLFSRMGDKALKSPYQSPMSITAEEVKSSAFAKGKKL